MTQSSRPQAGNCSVNPAYVDAGPWSRDEWAERIYTVLTGDDTTASTRTRLRGVIPTNDNMLVVTNPAGVTIAAGTGVGIAQGSLLFNDAAVTFTPNTPGIASRTDKVVIVENNTNVAYDGTASAVILDFPTDLTDYSGAAVPPYAARLAILRGDAATGNPTALIQTAEYWMIELARFNITNVPAVNTLTDYREFANIEKIVGVHSDDNDTIQDALILGVEVNDGVGAAGLGVGVKFRLENSAGTAEDAGQLAIRYTDAAAADETRLELRLKAGGSDNLAAVINSPAAASVDGNARGAGAVDLQQYRGAAADVASGDYSFIAGGGFNISSGNYSHAEGGNTLASGANSHAEGLSTTASNARAHAEGNSTVASGLDSHAEGANTIASGDYSHAEGGATTADGDYSHAAGRQADTNTFDGVFIWADSEAAAFTADRANQFKVRASGGAHFVQNSASGAIAVLELQQEDDSEETINFIVNGTGAGYPVDTATAVGAAYARLRIAVNGTFKYIQLYDA